MSSIKSFSKTHSFTTASLMEVWERFGYYGMQALIVYYMVEQLDFSDHRATLTWGAAAALIYVAPAFGGWIGDKILGTRRTLLTGAMILTLGYALLAVPGMGVWFMFCSLGVIVVGNGLFKANTGNLVRMIYAGDDSKIDSAFTIYYMVVNLGAMASQLLTPVIKNYFNAPYHGQLSWLFGDSLASYFGRNFGWHIAFAVCSVGLLVGLSNYLVMRHTLSAIGSDPDHRPVVMRKLVLVLGLSVAAVFISAYVLRYEAVARAFVYVSAIAMVGIFGYLIYKSRRTERAGLAASFVLVIESIFFFIFYQQMSTSLSLFALRNMNPEFKVFGWHLWNWDPAQFQALNAIWIFILSPVLAIIYTIAGKGGKDVSVAVKFVLGFVAVTVGFFIYSSAAHFTTSPGRSTSWIMVWGYAASSLGELLISGLGLAMIARYVPKRISGFLMGAYFVATGISQYLGGWVSTFASIPKNIVDPVQTMSVYTTLFFWLGVTGIVCTLAAISVLPLMHRLDAEHQEHAKVSLTSPRIIRSGK